MKMIKCNQCQKVYPFSLSNCPQCFNRNKKRDLLNIFALVFFIFCFIFLFISIGIYFDNESNTDNYSAVTYENFSKIENGMNYEKVVEIFGLEGELLSETDVLGNSRYSSQMYVWYDATGISNCTIMFQGGKVISKSQIGLEKNY